MPDRSKDMKDEDSPGETDGEGLFPGENWNDYYRGYGLSVSGSGEVWWQAYNGTDRLKIEPKPDAVVENLLNIKQTGGRVRVTEAGAVITKIKKDGGEGYEGLYVGEVDEFDVKLVPDADPGKSVSAKPDGLDPGDLWPSVYDGAKYSFSGDYFWWENPETKLRHRFSSQPPKHIVDELTRLRPTGGSFRITPEGDVLTQVPSSKTPPDVHEQFDKLATPVKRILKLRRTRGGVNKIPVYVGSIDVGHISVEEPTRLTDPLSEQENDELKAWIDNIDSYDEREIDENEHTVDDSEWG